MRTLKDVEKEIKRLEDYHAQVVADRTNNKATKPLDILVVTDDVEEPTKA